jgi:hypothetical protein
LTVGVAAPVAVGMGFGFAVGCSVVLVVAGLLGALCAANAVITRVRISTTATVESPTMSRSGSFRRFLCLCSGGVGTEGMCPDRLLAAAAFRVGMA